MAFDITPYRIDGKRPFSIGKTPTRIDPLYTTPDDCNEQLDALGVRMDQAQNRMHADEKFGLISVFQAMDAAGKDSSIRRVFKGVNPSRFKMSAFSKPEEGDLKHDFLWRFWQELPARGYIGVFNRSYYEEVLTLRVHPEKLQDQYIPDSLLPKNEKLLWKQRFGDIIHFEDYLFRNGFPIIKFYLHVDRQEQGKRLLARLDDPEKQWKLSENDLKERMFWPQYMQAYEDMINATATEQNPWYVIPSDDRPTQQLLIAHILTQRLEALPTAFPLTDAKTAAKQKKTVRDQDKQ
ncbi:polyphosphate kinase 2 family protein [Spirosoma luteolum]